MTNNDVTTRNENLPTAEAYNPYTEYGEQASMKNFVGRLLKFTKGDYLAGQDNEDIPLGTELVANMDSLSVGWMKWENNKPVEMIMGKVNERFQPPKRKDLDETDEAGWERDDNGKPRDPWQFTNNLVMKKTGSDDDDDLFTFAISSRGGINAIGDLCKIYGREMRTRPNEFPVIRLEVDSYNHPNKQYGRIKIPVLEVIGWTSKAEFAEAQGDLPLEDTATAPSSTAERATRSGATKF